MTDATGRRALLSATASLVSVGLAGCLGDGDGDGDGDDRTSTPTRTDAGSGGLDAAQPATASETPAARSANAATASETPAATDPSPTATDTDSEDGSELEDAPSWQRALLSDALEDETFRITDFRGSKVVLETFAVWCPICTNQQEKLETLTRRNDDTVVVSLNIDPNEDDEQVKSHAEEHGFDWRYAVAPSEVTQSLIDQFGRQVAVPPSAPVVRICPDGEAAMVESGEGGAVKLPGDITASFDSC